MNILDNSILHIDEPSTAISISTGTTAINSNIYTTNNTAYVYSWDSILKHCPYEELQKEYRKRNLKALLDEK